MQISSHRGHYELHSPVHHAMCKRWDTPISKRSYWRFFAFEMNKSQKGMTQFLIPGGNAAKLFEFVEEPFHLLASLENTEEYNL